MASTPSVLWRVRVEGSKHGGLTRRQPCCITSGSSFPFSASHCHLSSLFLSKPRLSSRMPLNATPSSPPSPGLKEEVFFDGGPHVGDLLTNLVFGLTLLWLPLTLAAVFRALFLRYRFTDLRVTVMSGLIGNDRKDFSYKVIKDVKYVPRFIGEWGDMVITLSDGTQVELKSVPRFREIAQYCLERANIEKDGRSGKGIAR